MNIFFTPRARARIREVDAWWRAHRPEAPMLIRRVLLEKTRQWLYYSVESDDQIIVHTVWGAQRGREPEIP